MRLIEHIETPWAPYSVMFSRDGTRLAIGGGSWYGFGGIALVDLATRERGDVRLGDIHERGGTVSGVAFSADDRHLVASTWRASQHAGPTFVFEVAGVTPTKRAALERHGDPATGIVTFGTSGIVRVHGVRSEELIDVHRWRAELGIDPTVMPQHLTSSRLVVVRGKAVTGDDQSRTTTVGGIRINIPAGLVIRWLGSDRVAHVPAAHCERITAIGVGPDDTLFTGGVDGEIDRWSWLGDRPHQAARLGVIPATQTPEGDFIWATYSPASVVGICTLANGRHVAVTAGGILATWRGNAPVTTWPIPITGTPRTIAAHPDRAIVAVGIKQGGFPRPDSKVALVELDPEIVDPAWRTPRVLEIAEAARRDRTAAGTLDLAPLGVLADALEEVGAPANVHQHLRHHDPRLRCCWVLDALLDAL